MAPRTWTAGRQREGKSDLGPVLLELGGAADGLGLGKELGARPKAQSVP